MARQVAAGCGSVRLGTVWQERLGTARLGEAWCGSVSEVRQAWQGGAGFGRARHGKVGYGRYGYTKIINS